MCESGASFVSVGEAASFLGTTALRILMMIKRAQLSGKMQKGAWLVERASLKVCQRPTTLDIVKPGCRSICGGCGGD